MNPQKLQYFKDLLNKRLDELKGVLSGHQEEFRQQTDAEVAGEAHLDFNHPADTVEGDPDYEKELKLIKHDRNELNLVEQALRRVEKGSYGICGECHEEISYARLEAIPYARFCIDCERKREQSTLGQVI